MLYDLSTALGEGFVVKIFFTCLMIVSVFYFDIGAKSKKGKKTNVKTTKATVTKTTVVYPPVRGSGNITVVIQSGIPGFVEQRLTVPVTVTGDSWGNVVGITGTGNLKGELVVPGVNGTCRITLFGCDVVPGPMKTTIKLWGAVPGDVPVTVLGQSIEGNVLIKDMLSVADVKVSGPSQVPQGSTLVENLVVSGTITMKVP